MIQLCTEGLGGEQTQAVWDLLTNSDGGDLEGSIVPDIAIEGVLYDVKTIAATTEHKVACGKSRDKLIERANVAHCSGGFAEAVLLRRRYAVMKEAARARRR